MLIPMKGSMLTANKADGLVLVQTITDVGNIP